jgi:REP element-mobilizing transposase RayT
MGYPLREEIAGAYYHVGTRGNNKRDIYSNDTSRLIFLLTLQRLAKRHDWHVVAYCLMNNHYHLVLKLGSGGLSRGMQSLNGGYAAAFNAREGRRDHLFGRRFWSRELGDADDVIRTCVYVDLNPTRSFDILPGDWPWNGHDAATGVQPALGFHRVGEVWRLLGLQPRAGMDAYGELIAACL